MFCCICPVLIIVCVYYILDKIIRSLKVDGYTTKYILVTGCDCGFGQRLALRLDSLGFPVFAGCLTDEGQKLMSEKASSRLKPFYLDMTKSDTIQKALELVEGALPKDSCLWAIVNNAGIGGNFGAVEMCTQEEFRIAAEVNTFGPIELCRVFLPLLRKSQGRVVNMASIAGRMSFVASPYTVSKFGMEAFSDGLRHEVYNFGVKVSIIEPGFFNTNILSKASFRKTLDMSVDRASVEVQTAYGGPVYAQNSEAVFDTLRDCLANTNIDLVVDAYVHAIRSRYPRTRYMVGMDAKVIRIVTLMPAGVGDFLRRLAEKKLASWQQKS